MALSKRGRQSQAISPNLLIWKVTKDLWHPVDNPHGYASLGIAENALMHDELSTYINSHFHIGQIDLTYGDGPLGSRDVRKAFAHLFNRHFDPILPVESTQICVTNGVSSAVEHLSNLLADPGDAILLGRPYFGGFLNSLGLRTGAQVITVPFDDIDPLSVDAVSVYEKHIDQCLSGSQKVAALVICNPHNPLGRCYPHTTLLGLMKLCSKHKIHLVSDEIYALSVFRNTDHRLNNDTGAPPFEPFISVCAIPTEGIIDPALVHIVYGLSKDFGANGLRIGCILSQHNEDLHEALVPSIVYSYASSLTESIVTTLLQDDNYLAWYLAESRRRLLRSYERVRRWADSHNIEVGMGVNSAFFLWVNLGAKFLEMETKHSNRHSSGDVVVVKSEPSDLDTRINDVLLRNRIFLASGAVFGSVQKGWFRIVFSQQNHMLDETLRRIEAVLGLDRTCLA